MNRARGRRGRTDRGDGAFPALGPIGQPVPISTGTALLEAETDGSVVLHVNGVPSSGLHPDPRVLEFEYMRWMQTVIRQWAGLADASAARERMECGHLGGGGCALPRALLDEWPASRHIAVERDALLSELVRRWFSLPRSPRLRIRVDDAVTALVSWREDRFDILSRDVFSGNVTPQILASRAVAAHAARVLRPGGLYLVNCAAPPGTRILADELATLTTCFSHLEVVAEPAHLSGKRRGNCLIIGSDAPLPTSIDRRLRSDPVTVRLADAATVESLIAGGQVIDLPLPPVGRTGTGPGTEAEPGTGADGET